MSGFKPSVAHEIAFSPLFKDANSLPCRFRICKNRQHNKYVGTRNTYIIQYLGSLAVLMKVLGLTYAIFLHLYNLPFVQNMQQM